MAALCASREKPSPGFCCLLPNEANRLTTSLPRGGEAGTCQCRRLPSAGAAAGFPLLRTRGWLLPAGSCPNPAARSLPGSPARGGSQSRVPENYRTRNEPRVFLSCKAFTCWLGKHPEPPAPAQGWNKPQATCPTAPRVSLWISVGGQDSEINAFLYGVIST